MGTYRDKQSERKYSQSQIDRNLRKAKSEFIEEFVYEHGFLHCERCKRTDLVLDVSHNISIDKCKKMGLVEFIWDKENFELLCRSEHQVKDRLDLRFTP